MFRKHKVVTGIFASILWVLAGLSAHADALDDLIKGLASNSVEARVEARQLLPRYGAQVAPRIIGLIADEREVVWRAAFNVLSDIANQVSVPGREADRLQVTESIMKLLAPERSSHEKRQGLRLIPFVLPDDHPVAPIAALLKADDGLIRERARAALEEARTLPACLALINALEGADPEFQYAILCSLSNFSYSTRIASQVTIASSAVPYASAPSPLVRAGVARVLAASGDPRYVSLLKDIRGQASPDTRRESGEALLLLADAMVRKGGNYDTAMGVYQHVLETEKEPALVGAALSGLGRSGDERAVAIIVSTLQGVLGAEVEASALSALQMLRGHAACRALAEAYLGFTPEQQLVLLGGFGRSGNTQFLEVLTEAAQSEDTAFRTAAANALAEMRHPGAVDGLVALALDGEGAQRHGAVKALRRLAQNFVESGDRAAAGKAYLGLYRSAGDAQERQAALEGVKRYPVPEAYDVLVEVLGEDALGALPEGTLGAIAESLWNAGRRTEARKAFDKVMERTQSTAGVEQAVRLAALMGADEDLRGNLGVVRNFYGLGPFPWNMAEGFDGEIPLEPAGVDVDRTQLLDGVDLQWKPLQTADLLGLVDLIGVFGEKHQVSAFAYTEVEVPEAGAAQIRVGSDDGVRIWVNGVAVHENHVDRGSALDQDVVPCRLNAGRNTILLQITQGAGGWNFRMRLTHEDGTPLKFKELFPK